MTVLERTHVNQSPAPVSWSRWASPWTVLPASVLIFACFQVVSWPLNRLWIDEYASLFFTDPSVTWTTLLTTRILPDTNPPLYQAVLAGWRHLFPASLEAARAVFLSLNVALLAAVAALCMWDAKQHHAVKTVSLAIGALLISGPVLYYAPEGRAYLAGMCSSFGLAWFTCRVVQHGASRASLLAMCALAVLAAGVHVFAALFAGSLAAGLVVEGIVTRRKSLITTGLAVGLVVVILLGVWLASVTGSMSRISWIVLSKEAVLDAFWYVRTLAIGPKWLLGLMIVFVAAQWWFVRSARPYLRVFAIAYLLFALLPLVASVWIPMTVGRYWLIGAPALIVLLVVLAHSGLEATSKISRSKVVPLAALGAFIVLASSGFGFAAALTLIKIKPAWLGAEAVHKEAADCPARSIRVLGNPDYYAVASGLPTTTFVEAQEPASTAASHLGECRVIGWAEHVLLGERFVKDAPDQDLLNVLGIPAQEQIGVQVRRQSGFVAYKQL